MNKIQHHRQGGSNGGVFINLLPQHITLMVCQNYFLLSKYNVILNVSEGSLYKYERFFLPDGRQNDKMIVDFSFDTPSSNKVAEGVQKQHAIIFPSPSPFRVLPLCERGRVIARNDKEWNNCRGWPACLPFTVYICISLGEHTGSPLRFTNGGDSHSS